jgi:hypothetical protein
LAGKIEIWREKFEIWRKTLIPNMNKLQLTERNLGRVFDPKVATRIPCNYIAMKPMVLYQLYVFGVTLKSLTIFGMNILSLDYFGQYYKTFFSL